MNKPYEYIKKSTPIQAIRWNGENTAEVEKFLGRKNYYWQHGELFIKNKISEYVVNVNDYVYKTENGACCTCPAEVFEKEHNLTTNSRVEYLARALEGATVWRTEFVDGILSLELSNQSVVFINCGEEVISKITVVRGVY